MSKTLTTELANQVWDILVEHCGASPSDEGREWFVSDQTSDAPASEYRFGGLLGFGGKLWNRDDRLYVNCYIEDKSPEVAEAILTTNEALTALLAASEAP